MTASQTVAYRFPLNWGSPTKRSPVTGGQVTSGASSAVANLMFDPTPTYGLASASSTPVALPERANGYGLASASSTPVTLPERTNAYADPATDGAAESRRAPAGPENRAAKPPAPKPSSNVLNDAQIASIKARLRLTPNQERYWPAVEAALRNITYKREDSHQGAGRLATVDPNSPAVQQLKQAAMPLLMTFSDEQKSEVRQIARLMGLEQVAQAF